MTAVSKSGLIFLAVLFTFLLVSCVDPATREEDIDEEELQEEIEDESETDEELDENDNDNNSKTDQAPSSNSGFTHTVEMNINGEITEGEGDGWWEDEGEGSEEKWWNDD